MTTERLDRVHEVARRIIGRACLWHQIDWSKGSDEPSATGDGRQKTDDLSVATAASSEARGFGTVGLHFPMIDIDVPAVVVPSSSVGHGHLYIDKLMSWEDLEKLLIVMVEVGLVEEGYLKASRARKATFLRLPWVRKGHEQDQPFKTLDEVEQFLETTPAPTLDPDPFLTPDGPPPF